MKKYPYEIDRREGWEMSMNPKFRIYRNISIIAGCFLVLSLALWTIKPRDGNPEVSHASTVGPAGISSSPRHTLGQRFHSRPIFEQVQDDNETNPVVVEHLIWKDDTNMFNEVSQSLAQLGSDNPLLKKSAEESRLAIRQSLLARQEFDWAHYPKSWNKPEAIAPAAAQLKNRIAYAFATTNYSVLVTNSAGLVEPQIIPADESIIQKVLEAEVGFKSPPMADYVLREGPEGVKEEIAAIKAIQ